MPVAENISSALKSSQQDIPRWYAVYVASRAEKKVNAELSGKDIEAFVPLRTTLRKWSDRKKWVEMPLIPGYCFVKIVYKNYLSVLQTNHVVAFVRFEGKPAVIPDAQIDFLKRMLKQTDYTWEVTTEKLKSGQKVEIIAGPFIGFEAELISFKGRKKVGVRIEQINNTLLIEIPAADLKVI